MTNKRFWLRMLVLTLVFGMTVVGCDDGSTDESFTKFDGTYINQSDNNYKVIIQGYSWISVKNGENWGKGTYTLSGNNASGRSTHAWSQGTWGPYTLDTFTGVFNEGNNSFSINTSTGWDQAFLGIYIRQ
jgi:hypothetical protein